MGWFDGGTEGIVMLKLCFVWVLAEIQSLSGFHRYPSVAPVTGT
jgi:hypothetical protein